MGRGAEQAPWPQGCLAGPLSRGWGQCRHAPGAQPHPQRPAERGSSPAWPPAQSWQRLAAPQPSRGGGADGQTDAACGPCLRCWPRTALLGRHTPRAHSPATRTLPASDSTHPFAPREVKPRIRHKLRPKHLCSTRQHLDRAALVARELKPQLRACRKRVLHVFVFTIVEQYSFLLLYR